MSDASPRHSRWFFLLLLVSTASAQDGGLPGSVFRSFTSTAEAGRAGTGALVESGPFAGLSNPAALGNLQEFQLGADLAFRGFGRSARTLAAARSLTPKLALGFAWFSAGNGNDLEARIGPSPRPDDIFSDSQNLFDVAAAFRPARAVHTGLGVKLYQQRVDRSSGLGIGFDLGGVWDAGPWTRLGLSLRDLGGGLSLPGLPRDKFPMRWGLGARQLLLKQRLASFLDLGLVPRQEVRWGLGAEFQARPSASLRAGYGEGRLGLGAAARIRHRSGFIRLDYALSSSPISFWALSHRICVSIQWIPRKKP